MSSLRSKLLVFLPIVATVAFLQYGSLSAIPVTSLSLDNVKAWNPAKQIAHWRDSDSERLAYRKHLEMHHAPHNMTRGRRSPTLTFDSIYVLSLATAFDRQAQMRKIARALGLDFTMVTATSKTLPLISWIAEQVRRVRDLKKPLLAQALGKPPEEIGGMGADSIWFQDHDPSQGFVFPDLSKEVSGESFTIGDKKVNWTDYLYDAQPQTALGPSLNIPNVQQYLWDPKEEADFRQHSSAIIACSHSHISMWRTVLERKESSALFMEDDVDIEWDIERMWPNALRVLPEDWEMVFLGHCWARSRNQPMYLNPTVRIAAEPRCLHAYALSARGAEKLLELVNSPWVAYQSAIDLLVPYLIKQKKVNAFLLEPPLIIQAKAAPSSIQAGTGNAWRGLLVDSTLDRIWRDEGHEVKPLTWEDTREDPSIWNS